ncbi:unnamed protein product [Meloidogyne enterolobii]|uniref:Uncharacterized protein n=1 Tax=Meloidogyne enterolobii TaxID=390850 RepID=A0ACB1AEQ3_MELEN
MGHHRKSNSLVTLSRFSSLSFIYSLVFIIALYFRLPVSNSNISKITDPIRILSD